MIGQHVSDRTIEEISEEIRHIHPPVSPKVERINVGDDREVIVIGTDKGYLHPYVYHGAAYRRVGNTTTSISMEEYDQMLMERMHSGRRWEDQPYTGWSIDDLDAEEIRRTVEEAVRQGRLADPMSRKPADMLRGLGLLRDGIPLRAAVVLFGNAERIMSDLPQCLLRVARFQGIDRATFLDNRQFAGNAFDLLVKAERFLHETVPIAARFEQDKFRRIDEPLYPFLAVREAIANALCHRDYTVSGSIGLAVYDDRLEVTSPGSLHFGLTPENLFVQHESRPWNPLIAHAFYRRGIIEEWGSGTLRMVDIAKGAGLPLPEIESDIMCVTVRFRQGKRVQKRRMQNKIVELNREVLEIIHDADNGLARHEILARMGTKTTERQMRRILEGLKKNNHIVLEGRGKSARWKSRISSVLPF